MPEPEQSHGITHWELTQRHDHTLYGNGNGSAGLVVKLAKMEETMNAFMAAQQERDERIFRQEQRQEKKQNVILGSILTVLGVIVLHYLFHIG